MTLDSIHKRLLDHLKTGVVLLDSDLKLLYINIAAEALLEMSDKKAKQLFIGDILIKAEEDIGEMQIAMVKNISFTKRKAELQLPHGKSIFVDYTLSPFELEGEAQALLEISSLGHSQSISREESLHSSHATTR